MPSGNGIGLRIRSLRERRGLSQLQLAALAGIRPEAISMTELGKTVPRIQTLTSVARALGVALTEILGSNPEGQEQELRAVVEELWRDAAQTPQRRTAVLRSLAEMRDKLRREGKTVGGDSQGVRSDRARSSRSNRRGRP